MVGLVGCGDCGGFGIRVCCFCVFDGEFVIGV